MVTVLIWSCGASGITVKEVIAAQSPLASVIDSNRCSWSGELVRAGLAGRRCLERAINSDPKSLISQGLDHRRIGKV